MCHNKAEQLRSTRLNQPVVLLHQHLDMQAFWLWGLFLQKATSMAAACHVLVEYADTTTDKNLQATDYPDQALTMAKTLVGKHLNRLPTCNGTWMQLRKSIEMMFY
uniref:Uncharacterized protein n=1 Tax=Setaria viridis TaxID=4556 RepID=A0A4U6TIC8_SETVI|nr:hypothetical protein SEVIR_8G142500v2 [Setaria viridis]